MEKESKELLVREFIREKVPDWDNELVATARFKAFSGQKSDWEPRYLFWRDLILTIAHQFNFIFLKPSEIKNQWFSRGGLAPLCLDHVLHLMQIEGDIIRRSDMLDPRGGQLSYLFKKLSNLMGTSKKNLDGLLSDDYIVLACVLQDRAAEVVKCLSHSNWTSSCVITMVKFQNICGGPDEATATLSYLTECGKARYLSKEQKELVEGVKLSLSAAKVPGITTLDYDILHLIWTTERLQRQLDVIDQRYDVSRQSALASLKSGNKKTALKHARELKITTESREKVASLLNRVEEVLNAIADAESTKTVSEAIQIGARAMKEHEVSWDILQHSLQELEASIDIQKQVASVIDSAPSGLILEEEDIEEEFKKLELEVAGQNLDASTSDTGANIATGNQVATVSDDSLSAALSNLKLVEETGKETVIQKSNSKSKSKIMELS
ncbi:charged multivesicular body protein 7 [Cucurbita moschata]|uniref:Charged multivesicular body protein 7 n=1 Tax=Cucurbita moschata TaxID=3662 RepID=A0A6J1FF90_CUCMO|nr:charged multivesicular body protein 7 [Cucurbita moschata]XP_022938858.1 charged multivesicular body protein 7 [Cucurbita moschata]XP_022938859.1 charged multivesicular body protein 7 [Cucurbita moschata]XP_022938860.1 charged multivesicular body protein 7 [Cucurbita moschata]XP_022938861.1 charged multivesicular body protein 7 [Cucurbita moschata]